MSIHLKFEEDTNQVTVRHSNFYSTDEDKYPIKPVDDRHRKYGKYLGCWIDNIDYRAMRVNSRIGIQRWYDDNTVDKCIEYCYKKG